LHNNQFNLGNFSKKIFKFKFASEKKIFLTIVRANRTQYDARTFRWLGRTAQEIVSVMFGTYNWQRTFPRSRNTKCYHVSQL